MGVTRLRRKRKGEIALYVCYGRDVLKPRNSYHQKLQSIQNFPLQGPTVSDPRWPLTRAAGQLGGGLPAATERERERGSDGGRADGGGSTRERGEARQATIMAGDGGGDAFPCKRVDMVRTMSFGCTILHYIVLAWHVSILPAYRSLNP